MRLKDLTDQWLIKTHFFGIYRTNASGEVYLPNPQNASDRLEPSVIQQAINESVAMLESYLDASIRFREQIVEFHDYDRDTFEDFCQVNLRRYPVVRVHSLQIVYGEHGSTMWDVPLEMVQIHGSGSKFGMLNVLPMWGVSNQYDPSYSLLFPGVVKAHRAPSLMKVTYDAGMDGIEDSQGNLIQIEDDLVRAIGLYAAIHPLNILGDIVLRPGVASISTSIDGISQSINTTASAENAAYSARIIMHRKQLFGEQGIPGLMEVLQKKWRRPGLALL